MVICSERQRLIERQVQKRMLADRKRALELEQQVSDRELDIAIKTQKLMQECGYAILSSVSIKINTIVTNALKSVFPDPYEFSLDFEIKYGRLSASMVLFRDGFCFNPTDDNGDGVIDIIALALRAAAICLDKRQLRRVMILDEPCGALSVDMQPYAGKLLKHLHEALGMQFIIVGAHGNAYREYADKEFQSSDFKEKTVI